MPFTAIPEEITTKKTSLTITPEEGVHFFEQHFDFLVANISKPDQFQKFLDNQAYAVFNVKKIYHRFLNTQKQTLIELSHRYPDIMNEFNEVMQVSIAEKKTNTLHQFSRLKIMFETYPTLLSFVRSLRDVYHSEFFGLNNLWMYDQTHQLIIGRLLTQYKTKLSDFYFEKLKATVETLPINMEYLLTRNLCPKNILCDKQETFLATLISALQKIIKGTLLFIMQQEATIKNTDAALFKKNKRQKKDHHPEFIITFVNELPDSILVPSQKVTVLKNIQQDPLIMNLFQSLNMLLDIRKYHDYIQSLVLLCKDNDMQRNIFNKLDETVTDETLENFLSVVRTNIPRQQFAPSSC